MNKESKDLQQDTSKLNPKPYGNGHTSWSSGIYPRNARVAQRLQINKCHESHQQDEEKKPIYDHLNRCREHIW